MEFKVKNKVIEIVFDYRTMFKVDKKLASKNAETGMSNGDGVGNLFNKILNHDDDGIVDLILLSANKAFSRGVSEDDAIAAIEAWLDEHEEDSTKVLFEEIQAEMIASGFFKEKILKYITNLKEVLETMKAQDNESEERALQIMGLEKIIGKMESAVS